MTKIDLKQAHAHSSKHKAEVQSSRVCGCFYCLKAFPPSNIKTWIDKGETAICPKCDVDAVIGSKSGYPVTDHKFLQRMRKRWFS